MADRYAFPFSCCIHVDIPCCHLGQTQTDIQMDGWMNILWHYVMLPTVGGGHNNLVVADCWKGLLQHCIRDT